MNDEKIIDLKWKSKNLENGGYKNGRPYEAYFNSEKKINNRKLADISRAISLISTF